MSAECEPANWANAETSAIARVIARDEGLRSNIASALREHARTVPLDAERKHTMHADDAGEVVREMVEQMFTREDRMAGSGGLAVQLSQEIGSLQCVNWAELGSAFLTYPGET